MTVKFVLILISILVLVSSHKGGRKPDQVIELFRHGARSPNGNYEIWPDLGEGQLTSEGMREHYQLGKTLAEKYSHLIETGFNRNDFYAVSNDVQRCIESGLVHLTSVFRGKSSTLTGTNSPQESYQQKLIEQIGKFIPESEKDRGNIVPIQIDVVDPTTKLIFRGNEPQYCPNLGVWGTENLYNNDAQMAWNTFSATIEKANSKLLSYQQIYDIGSLVLSYDAIIAAIYDKRATPGEIKDKALIKELELAFAYYIYHLEQSQKIQRHLSAFNTLDVVLREMANFKEGKNPKKMVFLSGHDKNLYSVLAAFDVINKDCLLENYNTFVQIGRPKHAQCYYPYFASNLVFEFYNDPTNPYVQFYYNDVLIPLCNGKESCSYHEFVKFVKHSTGNLNGLADYNKKCTDDPNFVVQQLERSNPHPNQQEQIDQEMEREREREKERNRENEKEMELERQRNQEREQERNRERERERDKAREQENSKDHEIKKGGDNPNHGSEPKNQERPHHQGENQRDDQNQKDHDEIISKGKDQDFHVKNPPSSTEQEETDKTIKAVRSEGTKGIISIIMIFIVAVGSILVFLRTLLKRRKYTQIVDADSASIEIA